MVLLFAVLSFLSTFVGGLIGLKYKDRLHLILGFTAGVLLGVVAFDILPEIIALLNETSTEVIWPMIALVVGFLVFHILEKSLLIHHAQEENYGKHKHPSVGIFSALALIGHSFLDGVGIGLAFQISENVGILVALAVIAHDFSDGLNTVSLVLLHKNQERRALYFLILDACAPIFGALSTRLFVLNQSASLLYLGFFGGFLLYICASDILPEAHSEKSSYKTIFLTICGIALIFLVTRLV
ncbi:ZIP family metal transporter [Candidatus Gottesmanbacteria bacterium]|nr:ZIP family metal transporter [Candidatus Gottesmanbacteria bacterium]